MGQDELPATDMDALREAVLGSYQESIGRLVRSSGVAARRGACTR